MDIAARIAQFENMCQADPENEMAHFSLAGAYAQAGRFAEAAGSYLRCAAIAPGMSKAYQLAGECYLKAGDRASAAEALEKGYVVATERGDLMPQRAIADMLRQLGRLVPEPAPRQSAVVGLGTPRQAEDLPPGTFICARTGRPGTKMDRPPFKGSVGQWIADNIAKETWQAWIAQGTKVINELRLNLSVEHDSEVYDAHMREFLGIDDELYDRLKGQG
jgi:Fe-S cluster biosynthesis and repair protein YggX/DNA-binding SARP family transcriptional activator